LAPSPQATLHLYRNILKLAKRFPSIKRDGLVQEIRTEFRANKASACSSLSAREAAPPRPLCSGSCAASSPSGQRRLLARSAPGTPPPHLPQELTDPDKLRQSIAVAQRGLSDLQSYSGARTSSSSIDLYLKGACD
jgi:hypothetical protein